MHSASAVIAEINGMIEREIIANQPGKEFAMIWDDCGGQIARAGFDAYIVPKLRNLFAGRKTCAAHFAINGWIGVNEHMHGTCVFTTLCLESANGCDNGLQGLNRGDMSPLQCMA